MGSWFSVEESTVGAVESWGSFDYVATPGCHFAWCGTSLAHVLPLRLRQTEVRVDTRTRDNVFVSLFIVLQWSVLQDTDCISAYSANDGRERDSQHDTTRKDLSHMTKEDFWYKAVYSTKNPQAQLASLTEEYFRIVVVKHKLDKLFDLGSNITSECCQVLNHSMNEYGYFVKRVVIKEILPEKSVIAAMNDIVASEKERVAAKISAEAQKIAKIKAAEAQAEVARLQGEGIALQRFAITKGLRESVEDFSGSTGVSAASVMSLLMLTQHADMIKDSSSQSKNLKVILEASVTQPGEQNQPTNQLRTAILSS